MPISLAGSQTWNGLLTVYRKVPDARVDAILDFKTILETFSKLQQLTLAIDNRKRNSKGKSIVGQTHYYETCYRYIRRQEHLEKLSSTLEDLKSQNENIRVPPVKT
jgi:hypothetical protein